MPTPPRFAPVSEAEFTDRVMRMGLVQAPATTPAAMATLMREGICAAGARQWLALLIVQLEGTYLTLAQAASFGTVPS